MLAPTRSAATFLVTGALQGNNSGPSPTTTSSAWCYADSSPAVTHGDSYSSFSIATNWTSTDAAICANRIIWAPPANCTCGLSQIAGRLYIKGPGENSAIMGNIYWPGPAGSQANSNQAACNYDANGIGGLLGEVICDTVFVQGGAQAGSATIGWTTAAHLAAQPEISLIE
jgi:hypothetical protein